MPFFDLLIWAFNFVFAECHTSMWWTSINGGILNGAKTDSIKGDVNHRIQVGLLKWRSFSGALCVVKVLGVQCCMWQSIGRKEHTRR